MEKKIKRKIRNKIWIISFFILISYVSALIINPTIWVTLLPVILSAGALTIGIPAYAIIKHTKESLENLSCQIITDDKEIVADQSSKDNDRTIDKQIVEENQFLYENHNEITPQKNKVKTKGTIR